MIGFEKMSTQQRLERSILLLSLWTGVLFVIFEFIIAIYTKSHSVLMDAAYDASELLMIGLTLFLIPLFHRPISEKHPFGYAQIESILVIIKGFMLLAVTVGLSANSIEVALSGGNIVDGGLISIFQFIIAVASMIVLFLMIRMNRSLSSPIIKAEIYGWKIDVAYSVGMGVAFFASTFLEHTKLAFISPYFDQIIAVLIILFMLPEALKMLVRAIRDVFLFSPEKETMENIKGICEGILEDTDLHAVFYDVTRTGRRMWVSIYFNVRKEYLHVQTLEEITDQINEALAEHFEHCVCELVLAKKENDEADIRKL
jgi:cation diffusion facilitator family transporter